MTQKHKRSLLLINRRFQLKFSFYVCSWLFALSVVYPVIIYNLFDFFARYLAKDPAGPGIIAIQTLRKEVIFLLVFFQLNFLIITFMISIFVSHRIAGPLHKLKLFLRQNGNGKISPDLSFRRQDHFQDLADEYNSMLARLRAETQGVRETIHSVARELEGMSNSEQHQKLVAELQQASEKIPH